MTKIERIKDQWSVLAVAEALGIALDRSLHAPCPACGGKDRFYVHKGKNFWACRTCRDKPGDVIDLVAHTLGCDVKEAVAWFGDMDPAPYREKVQTVPVGATWMDEAWQKQAKSIVERSKAALEKSEAAKEYLTMRGLTPETWRAMDFGFVEYDHKELKVRVREIVLPWQAKDGRIVGIRYRKIEQVGDMPKMRSQKGSESLMFGLHRIEGKNMAVFTEGEINGASLWQAIGSEFDVASFGGETQWQRCLPDMAKRYERVLVWADRAEVAQKISERVASPKLKFIVSPRGMDANEILSVYGDGVLAEIVKKALYE